MVYRVVFEVECTQEFIKGVLVELTKLLNDTEHPAKYISVERLEE